MEPIVNLFAGLRLSATVDDAPAAPAPCARCGGVGFLRHDVAFGHPNFGKLQPCGCKTDEHAASRARKFRELSNLGPLASKTFESISIERANSAYSRTALAGAIRVARDFAAQPEGWLVLTGPSGCGKTHLAAAATSQLLAQNHGALWVFVPDFLDHLRTTFNPHSDTTYDELFMLVRDAEVLVLDDFGAHSSSAWAEEKLYQILSHRYDAQLPTVITTSRLVESFDGRLRSRLQDPTVSRIVGVVGYTSEVVNRLMALSFDLIRRMTFDAFDQHPYSVEDAHRNSYNMSQVLGTVQRYGRDPQQRKWLMLMGQHGIGKTHLAAAIANERLEQGLPTLFIVTPDLLDALRASFNGDATSSYDKVFYEVRATPFLILDDFGAESATPWAKEKLYQVLNYRYNAQLPTLITTNHKLSDLDPALQSRLSDQEYCGVLSIIAPDFRKSRSNLWQRKK